MYNKVVKFENNGDYNTAMLVCAELGVYKNIENKIVEMRKNIAGRDIVSAGYAHTVELKSNSTVVAVDYRIDDGCDVLIRKI